METLQAPIRRLWCVLPSSKGKSPAMWRRIWREYKRGRRFETDEMEKLFERYVLQANKIHLTHLLGLLIATLVVMFLGLVLIFLFSPSTGGGKDGGKSFLTNEIVTVLAVLFSTFVFCVSLGGVVFHKKTNEGFLLYISYALTATFMVLEMTLTRNATSLWATAFFVYITYALLPIRLLEATISGVCLSVVHLPPFQKEIVLPTYSKQIMNEKLVNFLLLFSINVVGVLTHFPADMAKRKAFYEIRQYVRAKITIQKETVRQQRLLMSVLPEHLIEEMKSDLFVGRSKMDIKRKIYMQTYEPVSILFADIVGFTSLADRSAGSFVVELLNELYCSFDKLARKNRCMRIKLLGDCYYCVCGLPKPSLFHANHCVNMGLDMISVMQDVREKFNVSVDIRVGIHTGKLLCGVLGQKKWQFDIWSSDVEIANTLESSGMPGKVHISDTTKNCLKEIKETYLIEPGYGSSREPSLKDLETYFVEFPSTVKKVKIQQKPSSHRNNRNAAEVKSAPGDGVEDAAVPLFNPVKRERDIERELIANLHNSINSRSIRRLKKTNCKSTVLRFKDIKMERMYNQEPDRMLQSYFIAAMVVYIAVSVVQLVAMPRTTTLLLCTGAGLLWMIFACSLVMAWRYKRCWFCPKMFTAMSSRIYRSRNLAQFLALTTVMISYTAIAIPMVIQESYVCKNKPDMEQAESRGFMPIGIIDKNMKNDTCATTLPYPEHTLLYTILIMIMTGAFQIVMFTFKFLIMLVICTAYAIMLISAPYFMKSVVVAEAAIKYFLMIMALASFLLLMLIQSQQSEIVHRLDFVWKIRARFDTENAQTLQQRNQRLIENILPAHVAKHYLEKERPSDELYHEECLSACILFACVTNFSFADVGGEDPERNVAILHDIISDIDDLLDNPIFSSIEKIKSTGAVYMAASGLSLKGEEADTHKHVVAMAHFALTLRDLIKRINVRHNPPFGVKIGICVGPVVAGVIGASMPQYDIWGNTVNVASRMYSTGVESRIQVTENVALIAMKNGFTVEKRGVVFIKGKGSMVTYFLTDGPSVEDISRRVVSPSRPHQPPPDVKPASGRWGRKLSKEGTPARGVQGAPPGVPPESPSSQGRSEVAESENVQSVKDHDGRLPQASVTVEDTRSSQPHSTLAPTPTPERQSGSERPSDSDRESKSSVKFSLVPPNSPASGRSSPSSRGWPSPSYSDTDSEASDRKSSLVPPNTPASGRSSASKKGWFSHKSFHSKQSSPSAPQRASEESGKNNSKSSNSKGTAPGKNSKGSSSENEGVNQRTKPGTKTPEGNVSPYDEDQHSSSGGGERPSSEPTEDMPLHEYIVAWLWSCLRRIFRGS